MATTSTARLTTMLVVAAVTALATTAGVDVLSAEIPTGPAHTDGVVLADKSRVEMASAAKRDTDLSVAPTDSRTILWLRGTPANAVASIGRRPAVTEVTPITTDIVALQSVRSAHGSLQVDLAAGFRLPMSALFVDPDAYSRALADMDNGDADMLARLRPGQLLLSSTGAELRDVGPGAQLTFLTGDDATGLTRTPATEAHTATFIVAGIVSDEAARRNEAIFHRVDQRAIVPDGTASRGGFLVVHHGGRDETNAIVSQLNAGARHRHDSAVAPTIVTLVAPDRDLTGGAATRLVLSLADIKTRFGEFAYRPRPGMREIDVDPSFVERHITTAQLPILGNVRCHEAIIDDLRAVLEDLIEAQLDAWIDPRRYAGCHYARRISTERPRLSNHSWGIAIDLNVDLSLPGLGELPDQRIIEIFGRHGFRWGGDFSQPDHHHWEWVGEDARVRPEPRNEP